MHPAIDDNAPVLRVRQQSSVDRRVGHVAGTVVLLGLVAWVLLTAVAARGAENQPAAWRKIAQRAPFPVYRPRQTLGLKASGPVLAKYSGCLQAGYGNPRSRQHPDFGFYEPGGSARCGQPGLAVQVATAMINGVEVHVTVPLGGPCQFKRCTIKDGATTKNGFLLFVPEPAGKHYSIQLQSIQISLSHLLKVARSFVRVR